MQDSVKFIFKTLIKVPVIIMVSFLILNIFSWTISYFKIVGASYTVMQVGMENNYIPKKEEESINRYLKTLESAMLTDVRISGDGTHGTKRQYGQEITVGVSAKMKFIWPLMHNEQFNESKDAEHTFGSQLSSSELANKRKANDNENNINIVYTVPGLMYYPDMDN